MKHQEQLLAGWRIRTEYPCESQSFSDKTRQRIATLLLQAIECEDRAVNGDESDEIIALARTDGLSVATLCAELRRGQLALTDMVVATAIDRTALDRTARKPVDRETEQQALQRVSALTNHVEKLIADCVAGFNDAEPPPPPAISKKRKTLQHEIRTPLQGALLTTELMLEDANQGDAVCKDDIMAVRKSIETAVSILNDFASNTNSDPSR